MHNTKLMVSCSAAAERTGKNSKPDTQGKPYEICDYTCILSLNAFLLNLTFLLEL